MLLPLPKVDANVFSKQNVSTERHRHFHELTFGFCFFSKRVFPVAHGKSFPKHTYIPFIQCTHKPHTHLPTHTHTHTPMFPKKKNENDSGRMDKSRCKSHSGHTRARHHEQRSADGDAQRLQHMDAGHTKCSHGGPWPIHVPSEYRSNENASEYNAPASFICKSAL